VLGRRPARDCLLDFERAGRKEPHIDADERGGTSPNAVSAE